VQQPSTPVPPLYTPNSVSTSEGATLVARAHGDVSRFEEVARRVLATLE
jgi:hypothetical protein